MPCRTHRILNNLENKIACVYKSVGLSASWITRLFHAGLVPGTNKEEVAVFLSFPSAACRMSLHLKESINQQQTCERGLENNPQHGFPLLPVVLFLSSNSTAENEIKIPSRVKELHPRGWAESTLLIATDIDVDEPPRHCDLSGRELGIYKVTDYMTLLLRVPIHVKSIVAYLRTW